MAQYFLDLTRDPADILADFDTATYGNATLSVVDDGGVTALEHAFNSATSNFAFITSLGNASQIEVLVRFRATSTSTSGTYAGGPGGRFDNSTFNVGYALAKHASERNHIKNLDNQADVAGTTGGLSTGSYNWHHAVFDGTNFTLESWTGAIDDPVEHSNSGSDTQHQDPGAVGLWLRGRGANPVTVWYEYLAIATDGDPLPTGGGGDTATEAPALWLPRVYRRMVVSSVSTTSELQTVAKDVTLLSRLLQEAGRDLTALTRLLQLAAGDTTLTTSLLQAAAGDTTLTTSLLQAAAGDTTLTTSLLQAAAGDTTLTTSLLQAAAGDTTLTTSLLQAAAGDTTLTTSLLQAAAGDTTLTTSLLQAAAGDVTLEIETLQAVANAVTTIWQQLEPIESSRQIRLELLESAVKDVELRWRLLSGFEEVFGQIDLRWQLIGQVHKSLQLNARLLESAGFPVTLHWEMLEAVERHLQLQFNALEPAHSEVVTSWNILGSTGGAIEFRWFVGGMPPIPTISALRLFVVEDDNRVLSIQTESRTFRIPSENRTWVIE